MTREELIKRIEDNIEPGAEVDILLTDVVNGMHLFGFLYIRDICMSEDVDDPSLQNHGGIVLGVDNWLGE